MTTDDHLAEVIAFPGAWQRTDARQQAEPDADRDAAESDGATDTISTLQQRIRAVETRERVEHAVAAQDEPAAETEPRRREQLRPAGNGRKLGGRSRVQFRPSDDEADQEAHTHAHSPSNVTALPGSAGNADLIAGASDLLVRWLGRAPHSIRDARRYLREMFEGLGELDIENILDRMQELGYLNDRVFAEQLRDGKFSRKGLGQGAMRLELRKLGIADDLIAEVLGDLDVDDEYERALDLARERARRSSGLDYDTAFRRIHGYLARRGFGGELATRAVRTALSD